jgi:hypothetical protein
MRSMDWFKKYLADRSALGNRATTSSLAVLWNKGQYRIKGNEEKYLIFSNGHQIQRTRIHSQYVQQFLVALIGVLVWSICERIDTGHHAEYRNWPLLLAESASVNATPKGRSHRAKAHTAHPPAGAPLNMLSSS